MPEGPSIVILRDAVQQFTGQTVVRVSGNSKIDQTRLENQRITALLSWGKHFLICFPDFTLRVHLLLFGTYRINERKESPPRLRLEFEKGELNLYGCSIQFLEGDINDHYDWAADVMNPLWNSKKALKKLKEIPEKMICDTLLEQEIFAGVGNIIKNEVLYRVKVHPKSLNCAIPAKKRKELIDQASIYSFQFLEWKKDYVLKKNWLAHAKKICVRCDLPLEKKITGVKKRRSFFCNNCQPLYL